MKKKNIIIIAIVVIAAVAGAVGWYCYNESQKSGFVKGAEKTENFVKDVGKDTKNLFK